MPPKSRKRAATPRLISKEVLARQIVKTIGDRGMTQTEAARVVRDAPSQLSLLSNGHLDSFSSERLFRLLTRLGHDVEVKITAAKSASGKVRLTVK